MFPQYYAAMMEAARHYGNIENLAAWYLQNHRRTKGQKSRSQRARSRRRKQRGR